MTQSDIRQIEDELLNTGCPDDFNYNNGETPNLGTKIRKKIINNPKRAALFGFLGICSAGIIVLIVMIADTLFSPPPVISDSGIQMDGFDYLAEQEKDESVMPPDGINSQDEAAAQEKEPTDSGQMSKTSYFVNPTIKDAKPLSSYIQIGEKPFKLPVSVSELEQAGIMLVVLGSQPPAEDVILNPQLRNGYLQYEDYRFYVTLKNGIDCTYHDLTVVEVVAEGEGCPFYCSGGCTIGDEEASIFLNPTSMAEDLLGTISFYYWGSVENALYDMTGRRLAIHVSKKTGKVVKIAVFDDGSISDEDI